MKSKIFKKMMAAVLTAAMTIGVVACSNVEVATSETSGTLASESEAANATSEVVEETGITFPLDEEMTFTFMVKYDGDLEAELAKSAHWQRLYEQTNVKIEFIVMPKEGTMNTLNAMFQARQEGDAIFGGGVISDSDLISMADSGLLLPLNEYIENTELMPNFNERVLAESPNTKGYITTPDGNIYSLPKYTALEGNYLESPIWINKTWLDNVGLPIPKTLEELENALIAFRDQDANGNGDPKDEVPYVCWNGQSMNHLEALMGLWGIATKDSGNDYYVYIQDGKVVYAPTTDAFKDAVITLNRWYEEGLIWSEVFTANAESYNEKVAGNGQIASAGMFLNKTVPGEVDEQYVRLEPVKVEGYEPSWYQHPGLQGGRGQFSLTRSCENPEVLMAWIDLFYTLENTIAASYGEETSGRFAITADGKYEFLNQTNEEKEAAWEVDPYIGKLLSNVPMAFTASDYENRIVLSGANLDYQENFAVYEEYMTKEYWPRPYINADDIVRLGELKTDISNTVATKKAAWITGDADIEADWDAYVQSLDKMGLAEFVSILQKNYDIYMEGTK